MRPGLRTPCLETKDIKISTNNYIQKIEPWGTQVNYEMLRIHNGQQQLKRLNLWQELEFNGPLTSDESRVATYVG